MNYTKNTIFNITLKNLRVSIGVQNTGLAEKNRVIATIIQLFMGHSSSSTSSRALPEYIVYSEKSSRASRLSASICLSGVTILTCERV